MPNPSSGTDYLTYANDVSDNGKNGDLTATQDGRVVAGLGQNLSSTDSPLLVYESAPGGAAESTVDVMQISKAADDTGVTPGLQDAPPYIAVMKNTAGAEVLVTTEVVNTM